MKQKAESIVRRGKTTARQKERRKVKTNLHFIKLKKVLQDKTESRKSNNEDRGKETARNRTDKISSTFQDKKGLTRCDKRQKL